MVLYLAAHQSYAKAELVADAASAHMTAAH